MCCKVHVFPFILRVGWRLSVIEQDPIEHNTRFNIAKFNILAMYYFLAHVIWSTVYEYMSLILIKRIYWLNK